MNPSKRKYFDEINIVKGIAMLTVIWHHSMIVYPVDLQALPWCQHAMAVNHTYYLVVFFLVSGYLFAHSTIRPFGETVKSKIVRLLVPYLSFALVNLAAKLLAPGLVNNQVVAMDDYFLSLMLYGGELWFLYVLFLIFMFWPIFLQRMKRYQAIGIVLFLSIMEVSLPSNFREAPFLYHEFVYFSVYFIVGYLLKDIRREVLQSSRFCLMAGVAFLLVCVVFVTDIHLPYFDAYVKGAIGCAFIWALSFQILKWNILAKPLDYVGRYSLSYYWLNGFALVASRFVVVNVLHVESTPAIALSILCLNVFLITLAVWVVRRIPMVRTMVGIK